MPTRLNIFALPTRTTLLFGLIVLILFVPVVASLFWQTPICGAQLFVVMLLLPLRRFLALPARQAENLQPLTPELRPLQALTEELAQVNGVGRPPQVLLNPNLDSAHAFGTWTRRALALPTGLAVSLLADMESGIASRADRAKAVLLHELSHFRNRDAWMTFFSQSVIIVAIVFMALDFLLYLQVPLIYNTLVRGMTEISGRWPQVCDWMRPFIPGRVDVVCDNPQMLQGVSVWLRYEAFNLSAHGPFVLGGLILLVYFWRHIVRTREFYADARTAAWLGDADALLEAIEYSDQHRRLQSAAAESPASSDQRRWRSRLALRMPRFHPTWDERFDCLAHPETLYGSPVTIGVTAALAVLCLELILGSALSASFVPEPGSPTIFILGFVLLSVSLLPLLCTQGGQKSFLQAQRTALFTYGAVILGERFLLTAVLSLTLWSGLIPLEELLRISSAVLGEGGQLDMSLPLPAWLYVWLPFVFNLLGLPLLLWPLLRLDAALKQRVLAWFAAPWLGRRFVVISWGITGLLAAGLWGGVLPLLVVPLFGDLRDLLGIQGLGILAAALLLGFGLTTFLLLHRRWHGRCSCGAQVESFTLGRLCPNCHQPLNDWLLARYTLNSED
ncbi:MAG: M48 family metalloprotease [Anaerolineae bacterium]